MSKPVGTGGGTRSQHSAMSDMQTWLVAQTISKNEWCGPARDIRLDVWSNFHQSPELLRNYLCRDGSGYIRGYYNGAGIFYILGFHLRNEEWTDPLSTPA